MECDVLKTLYRTIGKVIAITHNFKRKNLVADFETKTFSKRRTLIELQNFKLIENPPFFIHAVSGWAFHKLKQNE